MAKEPAAVVTEQQKEPVVQAADPMSVTVAPDSDDGGPDNGLTAEENAQFEAMRRDQPAPIDDDPTVRSGEAQSATADKAADAKPAAPAAPAAAAAADPADAGDDDDDEGDDQEAQADAAGKKRRRVSMARLQRVERERDELQKNLRAAQEGQNRLDERIRIINEALQARSAPAADQQREPDDPEPNQDEDFVAHSAWQGREMKRLAARLNDAMGVIDEMRQGGTQQAEQQTVQRIYTNDALNFAEKTPAFGDSYRYLLGNRVAQLAVIYYGKDISDGETQLSAREMERVQRAIAEEEASIVSQAIREGRSPAAAIYALARASGFRPQANGGGNAASDGAAAGATQAKAGADRGAADGAAAQAPASANGAAPAAAQPSVKDEIDRIKRGVEASTSLSSGGSAPPITLTPQMLADMPQDEFEAFMNRLSPEEARRLMGG